MRTIRRGDVGQNVAQWQRALGITPDGVFGPETEAATREWQRARGLAADGVVGPKTWSVAGSDPTQPPPALVRGIDVSAMQGEVPWELCAEAGVEFSIMRCAIGNESRPDVRFSKNIAAAKRTGIVPGGYTFLFPLPHLLARAQAQHHVRLLEECGAFHGELVPMADLEWPPREEWKVGPDGKKVLTYPWKKWGCSAEQIAEFCLTYLDEVHRLTGLHWGVYTYRYWSACVGLEKYPEFRRGPLWLADYWAAGRAPTAEEVARLKPLADGWVPAVVQHDGNGGLRLPNGVDADFNVLVGGHERLDELAAGSPVWEEPKQMATASGPILGSNADPEGIHDWTIREYRATRLTEEPTAA